MKKLIKKIIIIAVVAIVIWLAYSLFFKKNAATPQTGLVTTTASDSGITDEGQVSLGGEFLHTLLSMKTISLNDSVLRDPGFVRLNDFSIVLTRDPGIEGRKNPFAPFGSDSIDSSAAAQVTTNSVTSISSSGATFSGSTLQGTTPSERWFEWGLTENLGSQSPKITSATAPFSFSANNLAPSTTYHVKAVSTLNGQTIYGNDVSFMTLAAKK